MYNYLITPILFLTFLICGCIWSLNYQVKSAKKTKILFQDKLIDLCYNAKTIEECNYAWNELFKDCLNERKNYFIIPKSYQNKFYELRAVLQGKLIILENK